MAITAAEGAQLGLAGLGTAASIMADKKRRKRLAQLRQSLLDQADIAGSNARGRVASEARDAAGDATQASINRGFFNSTVASDAATGVRMGAARQMADIDTDVGRQKAGILADTADLSSGPDLSGMGQIVGQLLARRTIGGGTSGSSVTQGINQRSPVTIEGGDPGLTSDTYSSSVGGNLESATMPDLVASAMSRRRGGKFRGYGPMGRMMAY